MDEKASNAVPENNVKNTSDLLNNNKESMKDLFSDFKEQDAISDQQMIEKAKKDFEAMEARLASQKKPRK
jgi:hypothetical protein